MDKAIRSLTLWAGLKNSSFAAGCHTIDAHQGGIADQVGNGIGDFHGVSFQSNGRHYRAFGLGAGTSYKMVARFMSRFMLIYNRKPLSCHVK
jgi:hypothetical protein